jgi:ubiquinone/menaquinone biosynthesis C-methylase UbiE
LPDGSLTVVTCLDVLEYIRNDEGAIEEMARVLAPGGRLRIRVPATGALAGFDSFNLMHYLVDTTRRGTRPHETSELTWRRHYSLNELESMLGCHRFRIVRVRRRRLALAEIVNFVSMVLFRWVRPRRDRYRVAKRLVRKIERLEHRIVTPFGFVLEIEAERLP